MSFDPTHLGVVISSSSSTVVVADVVRRRDFHSPDIAAASASLIRPAVDWTNIIQQLSSDWAIVVPWDVTDDVLDRAAATAAAGVEGKKS